MFNYDETDDDILASSSDNSSAPRSLSGSLPPDVAQKVLSLLKGSLFAVEDGDLSMPKHLEHFHMYVRMLDSLAWTHKPNAPSRAMFYLLDNMTEGAATRLSNVFAYEDLVLNHHFVVSSIESVIARIKNSSFFNHSEIQRIFLQFSVYLDIQKFCLESSILNYKEACEIANYPSDEQIVKFGTFAYADPSYHYFAPTPAFDAHYRIGPVENIGHVRSVVIEALADTMINALSSLPDGNLTTETV